MTQELPFFVDAHHRVRDTLDDLRCEPSILPLLPILKGVLAASKPPVSPPVESVSRYGRKRKQTLAARQASSFKITELKDEQPLRDKQNAVAPKAAALRKQGTEPLSPELIVMTVSDIPVANPPKKIGRPAKRKRTTTKKSLANPPSPTVGEASTPVNIITKKPRQPLGRTSLANTSPSEGTSSSLKQGGGKTHAHLALIQQRSLIEPSSPDLSENPADQKLPKITIKSLDYFASKYSTPIATVTEDKANGSNINPKS
jgi:hypothetical protein